MISVTRLDGSEMIVNAGHITTVEKTPDTVIELTTGERLMVKETVQQIVERVVAYRREVLAGLCRMPAAINGVPAPADIAALEDPGFVPEAAEE